PWAITLADSASATARHASACNRWESPSSWSHATRRRIASLLDARRRQRTISSSTWLANRHTLVGDRPVQTQTRPRHPLMDRRTFLQAGTIGALGLSMTDIAELRGASAARAGAKPRAVIFLFLTGGASQHDTFDMKPRGPAEFKGEFNPIATRTP